MKQNLWFRQGVEKVLQTFSVIAILFSPAVALAEPPGGGWNIKFSEDFNGSGLDTSKWSTCYWFGCSNDIDQQTYDSGQVSVNGGLLHLRADNKPSGGKEYTSGMIASHDKYSFKYGYAEMRAKFPRGNGFWSDFWLLSQNKSWPPELDIAEFVGSDTNRMHMTVHYRNGSGARESSSGNWAGPDFAGGYHTFGVLWEADKIVWYIDGTEVRRYTNSGNIPKDPMYLVATHALSKAWTNSPPDSSTPFPTYFDIDYIKVWQRN